MSSSCVTDTVRPLLKIMSSSSVSSDSVLAYGMWSRGEPALTHVLCGRQSSNSLADTAHFTSVLSQLQ